MLTAMKGELERVCEARETVKKLSMLLSVLVSNVKLYCRTLKLGALDKAAKGS